jgi:hypothetical protein
MKTRTIETIAYGQQMDMGGFPIRQAFPSSKADMLDPFLLLHHANIKVAENVDVKNAGCWSSSASWIFSCYFYF